MNVLPNESPLCIEPVTGPVVGRVRPPGSKSLTNRALIVAALARGESRLTGVLDSDDTQVMLESLGRLGINVVHDPDQQTVDITGCGGQIPRAGADLYLKNSGTSIRFLTALCALGSGTYRLDGNERMRQRPIGALNKSLQQLGVSVECEADHDCPPVRVTGGPMSGGTCRVAGDISSQYLSALLMAVPAAQQTTTINISGTLVSVPYVDMTTAVMRAFGVEVSFVPGEPIAVEPQTYRGVDYRIEPDASAASYFFAAAAITGGRVTVQGLTRDALQGDVRFVEVLEQMGCVLEERDDGITVTGRPLRGIDVDMNDISDTAQTLSTVAVFAEGPTTIRNIGHVRHKETDRIDAVATELRRLGITVETTDDGLTIVPGPLKPGTVHTYDDHRMAMSFALLGLRQPGICIGDPGCTAKTYPRFFDDLEALCQAAR